jgi:hypothetical protein|tara:strand:+ start:1447 stop:1830 length:384 start_codon:yes stop_codon:yes gene_type:complete
MTKNNTQITSLAPYYIHGQWVFDNDLYGLVEEAFVSGMSEIIDFVLEDVDIDPESVESGFRLTFSKGVFPAATHALTWVEAEQGGNVYTLDGDGQYGETMVGWLCPALLHFFETAPKKIYFGVSKLK